VQFAGIEVVAMARKKSFAMPSEGDGDLPVTLGIGLAAKNDSLFYREAKNHPERS
jgi:hypothetical protein